MPSEFTLIDRYFKRSSPTAVLGVGDDCALLRPTPGMELAITTDMLVADTHFYANAEPEALGWKTLAVNISDIAAMGGTPRWATLALALPAADEAWLAGFSQGFFACANAFGVELVGGDTTRGPLTLSVTLIGEIPAGQALRRTGARTGDEVWVSGAPGMAALGLAHLQGRCALHDPAPCLAALHRPQPRVTLGWGLRGLASTCIDVSDGLLADLGHVLEQSRLAATLHLERLPQTTLAYGVDANLAMECLLSGGDDYELVFTAPTSAHAAIGALGQRLSLPLSCIGALNDGNPGTIALRDATGCPVSTPRKGYDHFA